MPEELLIAIGRVLLGGLFVVGGIKHFFVLDIVAGAMSERGVPRARPVLVAASVFEIVAGLMLAAGLYVVPATTALVVFTLAASFLMLDFWNKTGMERDGLINVWFSNAAIIGGLLMAAAAG